MPENRNQISDFKEFQLFQPNLKLAENVDEAHQKKMFLFSSHTNRLIQMEQDLEKSLFNISIRARLYGD